jgi:hypothetical protein
MARNDSSRAPVVPFATKQARSAPAATPPSAKSRTIVVPGAPVVNPPAPTLRVSPAAASVEVPPVEVEVESLPESDDAG